MKANSLIFVLTLAILTLGGLSGCATSVRAVPDYGYYPPARPRYYPPRPVVVVPVVPAPSYRRPAYRPAYPPVYRPGHRLRHEGYRGNYRGRNYGGYDGSYDGRRGR